MRAKEFHTLVIQDYDTAIEFLRLYELLDKHGDIDPSSKYGGEMVEKGKKDVKPVLFFAAQRGDAKHGNMFFHYIDLNRKISCKLTLCEILEVYILNFVKRSRI